MNRNFHVTFEITTPDSAERGEPEDQGFLVQHGTLRECIDCLPGKDACIGADRSDYAPCWLAFELSETRATFENGGREIRCLHLPRSLTESTRNRIARLCGA